MFSSEEKVSNLLKGSEKSIKKKISNDPFYLLSSNFINHYRNNVHNEFIRLSDMTDLKMKEYKFSDDLCNEVINNWNNLRKDLEAEGVLFD